jgi:HEAT repeat protein
VRTLRVITGLAVVLLFSVPVAAEVDLAKEVARFASEEHAERYAAYTKLNRLKDPAVIPLLGKTLPGCPTMGQYYGMLVLQQFPPKITRPVLRKLATADSPHLRLLAGVQLQRMGERGASAIIVKALNADGPTDAERATLLMRLYSVRDLEAQKAIRAFLKPAASQAILQAAIYDIYLVRDRAALASLQALDEHASGGVRAMAGACRMLLGDAAGADAVVAAFTAGAVDTGSLYKVRTFLEQARPVPGPVLAAVHGALEGETVGYAIRTLIEILGAHGYAKAAKDIRALLDHEDANVSKAAFEALAKLPGGVSTEDMRKLLESGDDARKLAAADALRRADDASGFAIVIKILASGTVLADRQEAARLLANFCKPEAVEALLAALEDPQSGVRSNAYNSLSSVLRALFPYRRFDLASTGYVATGAAAARGAALAKIRAWWTTHKGGDW